MDRSGIYQGLHLSQFTDNSTKKTSYFGLILMDSNDKRMTKKITEKLSYQTATWLPDGTRI